MRQKQSIFSLFLLSPSSRRAWIEIENQTQVREPDTGSPSSRRAWIEIERRGDSPAVEHVALLAEGVDRNRFTLTKYYREIRRPPRGGRG